MIIPKYVQAVSKITFYPEVLNKWYCVYHEERDGIKIARYLHPDGWQRYSYWWDSEEEVEKVFNKIGQNRLEISDQELNDEIYFRDEYQKMHYDEAMKDLEKKLLDSLK